MGTTTRKIRLAVTAGDPFGIGPEVILGARIDSPEWAREVGFLDRVVAPDALLPEAREAAQRLGAYPSVSYAGSKHAMREDLIRYVREAMPADLERFTVPEGR